MNIHNSTFRQKPRADVGRSSQWSTIWFVPYTKTLAAARHEHCGVTPCFGAEEVHVALGMTRSKLAWCLQFQSLQATETSGSDLHQPSTTPVL